MGLEIQSISYPAEVYSIRRVAEEAEGMGLEFGEYRVVGGRVEAIAFAADGTEESLVLNPKAGVVVKVRRAGQSAGQVEFRGALLQRIIPFGELELGLEYPPGSVRHPNASFARKTKSCYGHVRNYWATDNKALDFWGHPGLVDERYGSPSDRLFLLSQVKPNGEFDEYKLMVGYSTISEAVQAYLEEMPEDRMAGIRSIQPSELERFRKGRVKPAGEVAFGAATPRRAHKCTAKSIPCKGRCISKNKKCREPVTTPTARAAADLLKAGGKKRSKSEQGIRDVLGIKDGEGVKKEVAPTKGKRRRLARRDITEADESMRGESRFTVKGKNGRDLEVALNFVPDRQTEGGIGILTMELDVGDGGFNTTEVGARASTAITREVSRRLKEKVRQLPDGVVIRQLAPDHDEEDFDAGQRRQRQYLEKQGFAYDEELGGGMGIVRNGKLEPYTYQQWRAATRGLDIENT